MNAVMMITSAVAYFAAAAVLALIFSFHKTLSGWIAGIGRGGWQRDDAGGWWPRINRRTICRSGDAADTAHR